MNDTSVPDTAIPFDVDMGESERLLPFDVFAGFDPLSGPVPPAFSSQFENIAVRARALLDGWTAGHIMDAADYLAFLLAYTPTPAHSGNQDQNIQPSLDARVSPVALAAKTWGRHETCDWAGADTHPLADPSWPCIFACYALAQIGLAHRCCALSPLEFQATPHDAVRERFTLFGDPSLGPWPLASAGQLSRESIAVIALHAITAMEAICCAENLNSLSRKISDEQITRAKNANAAKHAHSNALKRKVKTLYDENSNFRPTRDVPLSNHRVAEIIWNRQLTDDDRCALTGRDPIHTLAKWIGQFRKR